MKARQRMEQQGAAEQPENSCESAVKAFKGDVNGRKAESAERRFGCFVWWPTFRSNYLLPRTLWVTHLQRGTTGQRALTPVCDDDEKCLARTCP